ncbi:melanoma-associated antigen D2-like [Musca vetustissima]|uniref:melanoma-associated antigen D2-like n=1 Tax=Musca vetustissima TaxID=27455 RepID=UPI002AB7A01E|nr:melanoma-associated antigen D2-like [Musca vetustissima]
METGFDVGAVAGHRNEIITYILNGISCKLPMKEKDICAALNIRGKMFSMAFQQAKAVLQETYGIGVAELPDTKSGKAFICYNEDTAKCHLLYDDEQLQQLTLLFIVLSYLFMRGSDSPDKHNTTEENLENFLKGLRIRFDSCHEYFGGNVKKLLTETFVKQLYLKRDKVISDMNGETIFFYNWGRRAHIEFDKEMILKKDPRVFVAKYNEIYGEEENRMEQ